MVRYVKSYGRFGKNGRDKLFKPVLIGGTTFKKDSLSNSLEWMWDGGNCIADDKPFYEMHMEAQLGKNEAQLTDRMSPYPYPPNSNSATRQRRAWQSTQYFGGPYHDFENEAQEDCEYHRANERHPPPPVPAPVPVVVATAFAPEYAHLTCPSRGEILSWINYYLASTYTKIEDLCTGAAYCQIMDMLFPNSIPISKVAFRAKLEHEFIHNYKLLEAAFRNVRIKKIIPIIKLVQADFRENFIFAQWFKQLFDANYHGAPYDALRARRRIPLGRSPFPLPIDANKRYHRTCAFRSIPLPVSIPGILPTRLSRSKSMPRIPSSFPPYNMAPLPYTPTSTPAPYDYYLKNKAHHPDAVQHVYNQLMDTKRSMCALEKERDFYFSKLRSIEGIVDGQQQQQQQGAGEVPNSKEIRHFMQMQN